LFADAGRARLPWRELFDAVERPYAAAAESLLQSDVFMDALAAAFRLQRQFTPRLERGVETWVRIWGIPTRRDVTALVNQVASLERQVRDLARTVEPPAEPPGRHRPKAARRSAAGAR
jgi:hypothetical protein